MDGLMMVCSIASDSRVQVIKIDIRQLLGTGLRKV